MHYIMHLLKSLRGRGEAAIMTLSKRVVTGSSPVAPARNKLRKLAKSPHSRKSVRNRGNPAHSRFFQLKATGSLAHARDDVVHASPNNA